jgi:hypothetical protein
MRDSSIAFIRIYSLVNTPPASKMILFSNFKFEDMQIDTNINLINTEGLSYNSDIFIEISNLTIHNVTYSNSGTFANLGHHLKNPLIVRDSTFSNLDNACIVVGTTSSTSEAQTTRVTFINNQFDSFYSESRSLVSVYKGAIAEFQNCTFKNMHTLSSGAAITAGASKASVIVSDSTFTNSSAVEGSVFNIESESIIRWNNWLIENNFALKSGVVKIDSNGYFYFYDSVITKNYAKNNPISLLFDSANLSIIDKCKIYGNSMIIMDHILAEINIMCSKLWFVNQHLKEYINENIETLQNEAPSKALIQLISGTVKFMNSVHVYDQPALIKAFTSSVIFEDSLISSINMIDTWIEVVTSNFEFSKMEIRNISNPEKYEFISVSSDSLISLSNVEYYDSNSVLFNVRSSEAMIENIFMKNITNADHLFEFYDSSNVELKNFTVVNSSSSQDELIQIRKSKEFSFSQWTFENISQSVLVIQDSHFKEIKDFTIANSSSPLIIENSKIDMLKDSIFMKNSHSEVLEGGAIKIYNSDVRVVNSTFANNTAESGGAIHFDWNSMALCNLDVSDSTFFQNNAASKGGAIYYGFKRPQLANVTNRNNSAPYGPDLASYAVKIKMVGRNEMVIDDIGSNIKYEKEVKLALLDYDDQVMVLNNANQITLNPVDTTISSISGVNSALLYSGVATFDSIIAITKYGSQNVMYQTSSKAINNAKISKVYGAPISDNSIIFNFRNWKPGESIINGREWNEWAAGSYSFHWNSPKWYSCMDDAICLGKYEINVDKGFWRMDTNSTKIIECIIEDACEGGYNTTNENPVNWAEGYKGVLCTECQITDTAKYQRFNDFECQKCPNMIVNAIRVIGVLIFVFIFFMTVIIINVRKTKESEVSVLFRIMANYLQLLTTSVSFSSSFPTSLTSAFIPLKRIGGASDTFLSFDWFITDYEIKGPFPSNVLFKLFLAFLLPVILTMIVSLIWVAVHFIYKKWAPDIKRWLIISFISVVFLLHPKLTEQSFSWLRWIEIDDGESRVRADTTIEWFSSEHVSWVLSLSIPILVIWVAACPLAALFLLYKNIKKEQSNKVNQYLLILYQGLKKDKFYWEFVNTLRKVLLLSFLMLSLSLKILLSSVLLYSTIRLQIHLKPYKDEKNNKIEIYALIAGLITLLSSFIFASEDSVEIIDLFILIMIFFINAKFLLEWTYQMLLWLKSKSMLVKIVRNWVFGF